MVVLSKIFFLILCILPAGNQLLLRMKLPGNNAANLFIPNHFVNFGKGYPLGIIRFTGEQFDFLQGRITDQGIVIKMGIAVASGIDQLKLFMLC